MWTFGTNEQKPVTNWTSKGNKHTGNARFQSGLDQVDDNTDSRDPPWYDILSLRDLILPPG